MTDSTLYIERSKVREILLGSRIGDDAALVAEVNLLLADVDKLPITTAAELAGACAARLTPVSEDEKRGMQRVLAILDRKNAEGGGVTGDPIAQQHHNRFYSGRWSAFRECAQMLRAALEAAATVWRPMATAPRDRFILLYCAEDGSRWFAKWQGGRWHGVDELGLTREGHSAGDPEVVTGWAVDGWMPLPDLPGVEGGAT